MKFVHFRLAATLGVISLVSLTACGGGGTDTAGVEASSGAPTPVVASPSPSATPSDSASASAEAASGGASCNSDGTGNMPAGVPGAGMNPGGASGVPTDLGGAGGEMATPTYSDLAYAETSEAQKLDLYLPEDGQDSADDQRVLVINIHGGAFMGGDKAMEAGNIAQQLEAGYVAASLNYRLSCEEQFPAAVQDVKAAVRWLRAHAEEYGLDPQRFVIQGESAGGYLAQMVAITGNQEEETVFDAPELGNANVSSAVQAAVIWYGPNNFAKMDEQFAANMPAACNGAPDQHNPANSPESIFLGASLQTIPEKVEQANPLNYIDTATELPPFSIAAGDSDCTVPHQQSEDLHAALVEAGADASLTIVEGAGHGPAVDADQIDDALAFIEQTFAS